MVITFEESEPARPWQPGDGDSRCQQCGQTYEPWFTDHWVWNLVVGGVTATQDPGGYLCARCFTTKAEEVQPNTIWRLMPECTHFGKDYRAERGVK